MSYRVSEINGVTIEEYVTGRIVRVKYNGKVFELYLQSTDEDTVIIYLGHGEITTEIKLALKEWAASVGINNVDWGRSRSINKKLKI